MITINSCTHIVVTGSIAFDEIMNFPGTFAEHFNPDKLHQINISFVVDKLEKHFGGTATNIAYGITRLTRKHTVIMSALGCDHEPFTQFYQKSGIDYTGSVICPDLYTSTGKVMTDRLDNQIWGYYYGAGARGNLIDFTPYQQNSFFIISANHVDAFLHALRFCLKHNVPYLFDPGMALTWITDQDLLEGIKHASYIAGNDYEIAQIERRLGKNMRSMMSEKAGVITTLGEKGVRYEDESNKLIINGYPIDELQDPTGAGDAWRGGFIAGLAEGISVEGALKWGNALASFAIESPGTVNHNATKEQIIMRAGTL